MDLFDEGVLRIKPDTCLSDPNATLTESEMLKVHFAIKELRNPGQYSIYWKSMVLRIRIESHPDVLIPRPKQKNWQHG